MSLIGSTNTSTRVVQPASARPLAQAARLRPCALAPPATRPRLGGASEEMRFSINCSVHGVAARERHRRRAGRGACGGARWAAAIASNGRRAEIYRGVSFRALMELVLRFCLYSSVAINRASVPLLLPSPPVGLAVLINARLQHHFISGC